MGDAVTAYAGFAQWIPGAAPEASLEPHDLPEPQELVSTEWRIGIDTGLWVEVRAVGSTCNPSAIALATPGGNPVPLSKAQAQAVIEALTRATEGEL